MRYYSESSRSNRVSNVVFEFIMAVLDIYAVDTLVDHFKSLQPVDASIFDTPNHVLSGSGVSVADRWSELELAYCNRRKPSPDVFDLCAGGLAISHRQQAFRNLVADSVECLPIRWPGNSGYYLNVVSTSRCIDTERSTWIVSQESHKRLRILQPVFDKDLVPCTTLFKDPRYFTHTFLQDRGCGASHDLAKRIRDQQVKGLALRLVWQLEQTESWLPLG